jgi:hypothetical protein
MPLFSNEPDPTPTPETEAYNQSPRLMIGLAPPWLWRLECGLNRPAMVERVHDLQLLAKRFRDAGAELPEMWASQLTELQGYLRPAA